MYLVLGEIHSYMVYCNKDYFDVLYLTYEEAREQSILKAIELCQKIK